METEKRYLNKRSDPGLPRSGDPPPPPGLSSYFLSTFRRTGTVSGLYTCDPYTFTEDEAAVMPVSQRRRWRPGEADAFPLVAY